MNLNESVSVLWCSFIPHLSSCKNNALLKPSSARAVDLDISFGSWQIFSCFETKLKARLKVAMSIFLIIWNVVTINTTLPIKQIHSRMFSRCYAEKLTFYREYSGFLWDFQARWCVHTGCNMGFLGVLDLYLSTCTENWPCFLRTCWTCSLECLCIGLFSDSPKATRVKEKNELKDERALEKPISGYFSCGPWEEGSLSCVWEHLLRSGPVHFKLSHQPSHGNNFLIT